MYLVSLDSDGLASVARDVESGERSGWKIEVMRRVGTASLLRSRRGGVARWRERDGVGRWQLEVRVVVVMRFSLPFYGWGKAV
jgi:hypothetical protein